MNHFKKKQAQLLFINNLLYLLNDSKSYKANQMHSIVYSLLELNGRSILSIDLTGNLIAENSQEYHLQLSTGSLTLNKWDYLNKFKIHDTGKEFFMICNKQVDRDFIFNKLLEYAERKIETRIAHLTTLKERFRKERKLIAA